MSGKKIFEKGSSSKEMSLGFHEKLASEAIDQDSSLLSPAHERVRHAFEAAALVLVSGVLVNLLVVWTVLVYCLVYRSSIPSVVHFEAPLFFDFNLLTPTASLELSSWDKQWMRLDSRGRLGKLRGDLRILHPGEEYDVSVNLVLPRSQRNLETGLFMLHCALVRENTTVASSRRPVAIPYQDTIYSVFADVALLPFRFFLGWFPSEDHISVVMFNRWSENLNLKRLPSNVQVEISQPSVVVKTATLNFDANLYGFRYCMYYWFWTTSCLVIALGVLGQMALIATLGVYYSEFHPDDCEESNYSSDSDSDEREETATLQLDIHEAFENELGGCHGDNELFPESSPDDGHKHGSDIDLPTTPEEWWWAELGDQDI